MSAQVVAIGGKVEMTPKRNPIAKAPDIGHGSHSAQAWVSSWHKMDRQGPPSNATPPANSRRKHHALALGTTNGEAA